MGASGENCELISVGINEGISEQKLCDGDLLKEIYDDVGPKVVTVHGARTSGTGFFVENGDKVITNAHVAISESLSISTGDGKTYPAFVQKYDDTNDLALLTIVGIEPDQKRAIKLADKEDLSKQFFSVGHPSLGDLTISPGRSLGMGSQYKAMELKLGSDGAKGMLERAEKRIGPKQAADLKLQLDSDEIWLKQYDTPGSSGSPQVNAEGELTAVLHSGYDLPTGRMTGNIPLDAVRDLLSDDPGRFKFNYQWQSYKIQNEQERKVLTALELKNIERLNTEQSDRNRKPFYFDLLHDNSKIPVFKPLKPETKALPPGR